MQCNETIERYYDIAIYFKSLHVITLKVELRRAMLSVYTSIGLYKYLKLISMKLSLVI